MAMATKPPGEAAQFQFRLRRRLSAAQMTGLCGPGVATGTAGRCSPFQVGLFSLWLVGGVWLVESWFRLFGELILVVSVVRCCVCRCSLVV